MSCVENSNLWEKCNGKHYITSLKCKAWRVVEDQASSATFELVDSRKEHEILEDMLESKSKPPLPKSPEFEGLDFLLSTPFRYPPLKYGSRFGRRYERSLWYGAEELTTSFGESAFYRFLFFAGTAAKLLPCCTFHSAYSVDIYTSKGLALDNTPFHEYQSFISQKDSYAYSQPLGSDMRNETIEAFRYFSARMESKINIGVYTPTAFTSKNLTSPPQRWKCYTDIESVEFHRDHLKKQKFSFNREIFLVNNVLPFDHSMA